MVLGRLTADRSFFDRLNRAGRMMWTREGLTKVWLIDRIGGRPGVGPHQGEEEGLRIWVDGDEGTYRLEIEYIRPEDDELVGIIGDRSMRGGGEE